MTARVTDEPPQRIWILDYGTVESTWCDCPDPDYEDHSPVEYVRADLAMRALEPQGDEVRERVARAICAVQHTEAGCDEEILPGTPHWVGFMPEADAAIAAIGEKE